MQNAQIGAAALGERPQSETAPNGGDARRI
jgi:hypothetical protein